MIGNRVTPVPDWVATAIAGGMVVTAVVYVVAGVIHLQKQASLKQAHNDLKWIGLALHNYHDTYNSFPPPIVYDAAGKPMHSWRSLIQPHFSAAGDSEKIFAMYRFDEQWDGPNNIAAANVNRFNRQDYSFLAVVGPDAAWERGTCRRIREFNDGLHKTILVIGIRDIDVGWHEPRDLIYDGEKLWLQRDGTRQEIDLSSTPSFLMSADTSVRYWETGLSADVAKPLFTPSAGDAAPEHW